MVSWVWPSFTPSLAAAFVSLRSCALKNCATQNPRLVGRLGSSGVWPESMLIFEELTCPGSYANRSCGPDRFAAGQFRRC